MKKTIIAFIAAIAFCMTIVSAFQGGTGTESDPYQISTCTELQNMTQNNTAYYELISNIDCSDTRNWNNGSGWETIGNDSKPFSGNLDGQGYSIYNLTSNRTSTDNVAIFYSITGVVKNINFDNLSINGRTHTGGIASYIESSGLIKDIQISGLVHGRRMANDCHTGGIASVLRGTIKNSELDLEVIGSHPTYSTHTVGVVCALLENGYINNTKIHGSATVEVRVSSIAGASNGGIINNTYSDAYIEGVGEVAGFIGRTQSGTTIIENSLFNGTVNADDDAGGFVGYSISEVNIKNSYVNADLDANYCENAGGFIGITNSKIDISNSYANVSLWAENEGGFTGGAWSFGSGSNISNFYYSGTPQMCGSSDPLCNNSFHLTNEELLNKSSFQGFNFTVPWGIKEGISSPYIYNIIKKNPKVSILSPTKNIRTNVSEWEVFFNFSDMDDTSADCELLANGIKKNNLSNCATNTEYSMNLSNLTPKIYDVQIVCYDSKHKGVSNSFYYDYDNRTPFIQSTNPSFFNTSKVASSPMNIQGNVSDRALNLVNLTIFYPNGTIFWNDYQNLSDNATEYSWSENFAIGNDTDGIWTFKAEAADDMQVTELPGLNPTSKTAEFEVDVCEENFTCVEYGPCTELNLKYCQEVNDTSGCDENYNGDMAEFTQVCTYKDESAGGGGGGGFSYLEDDEEQQEATNTTTNDTAFAVGDADAQKPDFLNQIPWYGYVGAAAVALGVYQFGFNSKPKKKKRRKKR